MEEVSTRRVDDLIKALGCEGISKSQVSRLCLKIVFSGGVVLPDCISRTSLTHHEPIGVARASPSLHRVSVLAAVWRHGHAGANGAHVAHYQVRRPAPARYAPVTSTNWLPSSLRRLANRSCQTMTCTSYVSSSMFTSTVTPTRSPAALLGRDVAVVGTRVQARRPVVMIPVVNPTHTRRSSRNSDAGSTPVTRR